MNNSNLGKTLTIYDLVSLVITAYSAAFLIRNITLSFSKLEVCHFGQLLVIKMLKSQNVKATTSGRSLRTIGVLLANVDFASFDISNKSTVTKFNTLFKAAFGLFKTTLNTR